MATDWRVVAQRQVSNLTSQGTFQEAMEVTFETIPEGVTGVIAVPLAYYNEDYIREQLDNRVATIKAVGNL